MLFATEVIKRSSSNVLEARAYLEGMRSAIDGFLANEFRMRRSEHVSRGQATPQLRRATGCSARLIGYRLDHRFHVVAANRLAGLVDQRDAQPLPASGPSFTGDAAVHRRQNGSPIRDSACTRAGRRAISGETAVDFNIGMISCANRRVCGRAAMFAERTWGKSLPMSDLLAVCLSYVLVAALLASSLALFTEVARRCGLVDWTAASFGLVGVGCVGYLSFFVYWLSVPAGTVASLAYLAILTAFVWHSFRVRRAPLRELAQGEFGAALALAGAVRLHLSVGPVLVRRRLHRRHSDADPI